MYRTFRRPRAAVSLLPFAVAVLALPLGAQPTPIVAAPLAELRPGEPVRLWQRASAEAADTARRAEVAGRVTTAGPAALGLRDAHAIEWQFATQDIQRLEVQRGRRRSFRGAVTWGVGGLAAGSLVALGMKMSGSSTNSYRTSTRETVMSYRWAMGLGTALGVTTGALWPHDRWVPVAVAGAAPPSPGDR